MKKLFLYIFLILWCCNFANNANAVVKKHAGTGELHLSEKIIDEYFNYITRPLNELPLVFFISEDKKISILLLLIMMVEALPNYQL